MDFIETSCDARAHKCRVQYARIVTLPYLIFELFPFVDFSCPEHSFSTVPGWYIIFDVQIDINMEKCSAQEW